MIRKQANVLIIKMLLSYIIENPEIRFNQMLINLGIVTVDGDDFHVESTVVLKKLRRYHAK